MRPERLAVLALTALLAAAGCSRPGSDTLGPSVEVAALPSPTPAPPSPTPAPTPPPEEGPDPSPSPACIHGTWHGVHSVSLAVYFLECGGQRIPGSPDMRTVPLGCRIHFNATPRDGMGQPTCSRSWPVWQVGPEELLSGGGGETFTPAYTTRKEGRMSARCIVDGVRSGWIVLDIVNP